MQTTALNFKANVTSALANVNLRQSLKRVETNWVGRRAEAAARLPEFEALRDQAREDVGRAGRR